MKITRNILILSLMLVCMSACSISARIKRADKRFAIGEYYEAGEQYRQVYRNISSKDKPLKAYVAFQQGECNRILNNTKATTAYKNAIRYLYFHTDSIVFLRYAQALHYQGKYKDAIKQYDIYLNTYPDHYVAQAGKYACLQMEDWKQQKSRYNVNPVKAFNAKRSSNMAPALLNADGDAIVFSSNRSETKEKKGKNKVRVSSVTGAASFNLYSARKNAAGQWEDIALCEGLYSDEPSEEEESSIGSKQSTPAELGVCSFSPDGRTMYFTYSKPINGQDLGAKIYSSQRASGEWSEAQEVKLFSDSSITVGHPTINATGDTMYFVSDAPGGFGGKDIYMAISDGSTCSDISTLGP
ncbi:MAG: PD40 domain-containing protein, partial [Paludibacteraceae bacterium]|nr:PD40 domain-containing protein [Paludibacteraceae bacterium]